MNAVGPAILGVELLQLGICRHGRTESHRGDAVAPLRRVVRRGRRRHCAALASRWIAVALAYYSVALSFALVYLGEHYIADIIAGAAEWRLHRLLGAVEGGRYVRYCADHLASASN